MDLSSIAPHLIELKSINIESNEQINNNQIKPFIYTGSIDTNNEYHHVHLEGFINQNNEIISISIDCDSRLNCLLLNDKELLKSRLDKCTSIQDVVFELKNIIEQAKKNPDLSNSRDEISLNQFMKETKFINRIMQEIEDIGWNRLIDCNENLTMLTFNYEENSRIHKIKISLSDLYPKKEPTYQTDLPANFEFNWNENSTLREIYEKFQLDIENFKVFWDEIQTIDENCWILEPLNPSLSDTHRRINLLNNASLLIKIDPRNPREIPEILFLGSENSIQKYKTAFEENYHDWNNSFNLIFNLEEILNIKFQNKNDTNEEESNLECSICYSFLFENQGPDIFCEQINCNKSFHQSCLYEWLKGIPSSKVMFGFIYGQCPYCAESIKCKLSS